MTINSSTNMYIIYVVNFIKNIKYKYYKHKYYIISISIK